MLIKMNKSNLKKLFVTIMVFMMVFSVSSVTFAATPINFLGAYLTTINLQDQTSSIGILPTGSTIDNTSVSPGQQSIDILTDKNIVAETIIDQNKGCIKLKDLSTGLYVSISVYRLGDGSNIDVYRDHIFFDANLVGGHDYQIQIDGGLIANNGLTLGTTKYINFTVAPVTPVAPSVTADDANNKINAIDKTMEFIVDNAAGYTQYNGANLPDLSGEHTVLVRVAAEAHNPAGPATTLTFTKDPVTPVVPAVPAVTADNTANKVTGMAAGMEYNLDGAGYVAYDATTFNSIDFSGNHTLLVRVAAEGINPAGQAKTLTFTTNPVTPVAVTVSQLPKTGSPIDFFTLIFAGISLIAAGAFLSFKKRKDNI
jgi:LPXTG-motif cell wall-anchored protein